MTPQSAPTAPPVRVADVAAVLEDAYPPHLAEDWDRVGLVCGDPDEPVRHVAFALEATEDVVAAALDTGADMLVVHHPLLLRGVSTVATDTPKGRLLHDLIRGGCALFAAHTNADRARPGTNDHLARLLGITPGRPIVPVAAPGPDRWVCMVPDTHVEAIRSAVFAAGAGAMGDYADCSFEVTGTGQFRPLAGATPFVGAVGELERVTESRLEWVAPRALRATVATALRAAHPYEEPAVDVLETHTPVALDAAAGLGRIGELDEPLTLRAFVGRVADRLPATIQGIRAAGDPDAPVRTVALCSGSGDSLLDTVARLDVDVYLTSDLRHHPADEHLRAGGCALVDVPHWAGEFPWTDQALGLVADALDVTCEVLAIRTDPWVTGAGAHAR